MQTKSSQQYSSKMQEKTEALDLTGKEVAVVGGGNVSMDAVRTAKRLGAKKVSIVYRRRVADMTALPAEIEGAIAEGIEVQTLKRRHLWILMKIITLKECMLHRR